MCSGSSHRKTPLRPLPSPSPFRDRALGGAGARHSGGPRARIPGFGIESPLDFPFAVAAKTGTSRHFTDNWAVGAAGGFTVAVWVGNFSGRPMDGVSGMSGAGPLLHRAVLATARRYPTGSLPDPRASGALTAAVCRLSGLRPGAECPMAPEWFAPGHAPADTCTWHDGNGAVELPVEYTEWAEQSDVPRSPRPARSPAPPRGSGAEFRIVSPREGDVYRLLPGVEVRYATVALRAAGGRGGAPVRWTVDDVPYASGRWSLRPGRHRFRAISASGDSAEVTVRVE